VLALVLELELGPILMVGMMMMILTHMLGLVRERHCLVVSTQVLELEPEQDLAVGAELDLEPMLGHQPRCLEVFRQERGLEPEPEEAMVMMIMNLELGRMLVLVRRCLEALGPGLMPEPELDLEAGAVVRVPMLRLDQVRRCLEA